MFALHKCLSWSCFQPSTASGKTLPMQEIQTNRELFIFEVFLDGCMFFVITWLTWVSLSRRVLVSPLFAEVGWALQKRFGSLWRTGRGGEGAAAVCRQGPLARDRAWSVFGPANITVCTEFQRGIKWCIHCRLQTGRALLRDPSPSLSSGGFCSAPSPDPCPLSLQAENCIFTKKN